MNGPTRYRATAHDASSAPHIPPRASRRLASAPATNSELHVHQPLSHILHAHETLVAAVIRHLNRIVRFLHGRL